MKSKVSMDLVLHRIEQSKEDLMAAEILYKSKLFKSANNRAYYSIFHAIRAVLALEPIDFKKHKDVLAYFNKSYVRTEIFPKQMGKKIAQATTMREDSDYDDEFVVNEDKTLEQINTAKELINLVEKYIENK